MARVVLALVALLWAGAAQAAWRVAETANFRIHADADEAELIASARLLEDFDALLRSHADVGSVRVPAPLDVYVADAKELRRGTEHGKGVLGFYTATPGGVAAFAREDETRGVEPEQVLFHEYAHHFQLQHLPHAYPVWYVEGFAEYFTTARFEGAVVHLGAALPNRAAAFRSKLWIPLGRLVSAGEAQRALMPPGLYHAQSWLFVHYALADPQRRAALEAFVDALGRGERAGPAFERAFGAGFATVDKRLRRYARELDGKPTRTVARRSAAVPVEVAVRRLPRSADALLLSAVKLRLGLVRAERAADELARVRRAGRRYGKDPFAQRTLANAEIMLGERARGEALLEQRLADEPGDWEAQFLKGWSALVAAAREPGRRLEHLRAARPWFERAHALNPVYAPALFGLGETLLGEPSTPDRETLEVLLRARALAPQVAAYNLAAGYALLFHRRFDEAEQALARVAYSPHGGPLTGRAEHMLQLARERRAPTIIQLVDDAQWKAPFGSP